MKKHVYDILLLILISFPFNLFSQGQISQNKYFSLHPAITQDDYLKGVIVFKITEEYANTHEYIDDINFISIINWLKVDTLFKKFPTIEAPRIKKNELGLEYADLSRIYELHYSADVEIEKAINLLLRTGIVEYAEPKYKEHLLYTPNDPYMEKYQYYIYLINLINAWDISKGDTNITIGIIDTGIDINHPDLTSNIKKNFDDPPDGVDNDNDGFVDNYMGWNFAYNSNNPQYTSSSHGVHVAGVASASTDNGVGVAGVGFKCKIMPLKIFNDNNVSVNSYEAIVYAAEHGCTVANCSWGSKFTYSQFAQDVITYATINKNMLVVAAAGNDGNQGLFYPASYEYVISVGASNQKDCKWEYSNYGPFVDIFAPGQDIMNTWANGTYYSVIGGTSFAAPIISGCAALLKSYRPDLTALQIGEQLKVTSDKIDTLDCNYSYKNFMGAGRVNMFKAMTDFSKPSIVFSERYYTDNNDDVFISGDTIDIYGIFINYLSTATNVVAEMTSLSKHCIVLNSKVNLGYMNTLTTKNNINNPFKVYIKDTYKNEEILLKITYTDEQTGYVANQYIKFTVNPDFLTVSTDEFKMTVAGNSNIGYRDFNVGQGKGFVYKDYKSILYTGGLVVGVDTERVSDNIYGNNSVDMDFKTSVVPYKNISPYAPYIDKVEGEFDDIIDNNPYVLNIRVKFSIYARNLENDRKYAILNYKIHNCSDISYRNLYVGLYADWDVENPVKNVSYTDTVNRYIYTYSLTGGPYVAIKALSKFPINYYSFDNNGENNSIMVLSNFTSKYKYLALSSNRYIAGGKSGNDVSSLISYGPFNLISGDSLSVSYAIIIGDYLPEIEEISKRADLMYQEDKKTNITLQKLTKYVITPNPVKDVIYISNITDRVLVQIYSLKGEIVVEKIIDGGKCSSLNNIDVSFLQHNELYLLKITDRDNIYISKIIKL